MRKLKLKIGKEMLTKEQMKKINGGYGVCDYVPPEPYIWYCCDSGGIWVIGWMECQAARDACTASNDITTDPYNGCG